MRIRIGKKSLIAVGITGSILFCGVLFKMATGNDALSNHSVAHVGSEHSGLSDAVKDLLDGKKEARDVVVDVDSNVNAAVLAGVTMSEDEKDAVADVPAATTEEQEQGKVDTAVQSSGSDADAATQTSEPVQDAGSEPEPAAVYAAESVPVETVVESVRTVTVSTPVTREVSTTVDVPIQETVVEEVQTQSFKDAFGTNSGVGVQEAMKNIITPEFKDDGEGNDYVKKDYSAEFE